jgi:hypothetical protein
MSNTKIELLLPIMRLVQGSLSKPQDKDGDGKPLVIKSGPNQGKPTIKYFIAGAIEKKPGETHWGQTEWGAKLWALAHSTWPNGQAQAPTFAWKVEDGDNAIPNKKGKKNIDREGFKGHWIVNLSTQFAPKTYNTDNTDMPAEMIKLGYYVQVYITADSNRSDMNPGLFLNPSMVKFQGFGPEIHTGPDPSAVAWGGAAPAGMASTPVGSALPSQVPGVPAAGAPAIPGAAPAIPAAAPAVPAAAPAVPQVAVQAQPAMIAPPAVPAAPAAAPAEPVVLLPGVTWAQLVAANWTEATARAAGHIR